MAAPFAGRLWLNVPFAENIEAKALGARWDGRVRRWYAPRPGMPGLARWAAEPDRPDLLPGEDRTYGQGLFVDLIPQTSWFTNVRGAVDPADWDQLRRMVYRRAGYRCEACGDVEDRGRGVQLEAHERFTYDAPAGIQRLVRLVCLCSWCHIATHMGMAGLRGIQTEAVAHLMAVTGMSPAQADEHIGAAFVRWERRSRADWHVDLSIIAAAGIRLREPQRPMPGQPRREEDEDAGDVLIVTTAATIIRAPAPVAREPGPAERALAATYERYAGQLAEIEALRKGTAGI